MKKIILILFVLLIASTVRADNFGCTSILCLASPDGPTQYEECRPTIKKLYKILYDGEPFPDCTEAEYDGVDIKQGVEAWEPCGAGYTQTIREDYRYEAASSTRVCRKQVGWKLEYSWEESGGQVKMPVYHEYKQKRNPEPNYIEVYLDNKQQGERFWYKINKKKKGWF